MDKQLIEMMGKMMEQMNVVQSDLKNMESGMIGMQTDMKDMKVDMADMKTDMKDMKVDMADMKTDMKDMKVDMADMKTDMNARFDAVDDKLNGVGQHIRRALKEHYSATRRHAKGIEICHLQNPCS